MKCYKFDQDNYPDGKPPIGDDVICLYEGRIFGGRVVDDEKKRWGVKIPTGRIVYPFGSDCLKMGSVINEARSIIV